MSTKEKRVKGEFCHLTPTLVRREAIYAVALPVEDHCLCYLMNHLCWRSSLPSYLDCCRCFVCCYCCFDWSHHGWCCHLNGHLAGLVHHGRLRHDLDRHHDGSYSIRGLTSPLCNFRLLRPIFSSIWSYFLGYSTRASSKIDHRPFNSRLKRKHELAAKSSREFERSFKERPQRGSYSRCANDLCEVNVHPSVTVGQMSVICFAIFKLD